MVVHADAVFAENAAASNTIAKTLELARRKIRSSRFMCAYPFDPDSRIIVAHAGVFFVGDNVAPHQHVVVRDGLHVLDVLRQNQ